MTNRRKILQNAQNVGIPSASNVNTPFTIVNWLGPIGSFQPHYLDTNLLGNVRLRITLSSPNVLVGSNVTAPTFTLNNMFFSVDCLSIDDGAFYQTHEAYLAQGGVYELPFKNFLSFSATAQNTGATKFSLSTQSLDKVWATFVSGTGVSANSNNGNINTAFNFSRSGKGSGTNGDGMKYQFNINNQYYPNYQPTNTQAYTLTQNAYNLSQDTLGGIYAGCSNLALWNQNYWVACQSFNHDCDGDERFISGLDTRGNVAQGFFEYSGFVDSASNPTSLIFAQTSPVLRVGAGQQLDLEQ